MGLLPRCFVFDSNYGVNRPQCQGCHNPLGIKEVFSIEPQDLRALVEYVEGVSGKEYQYYSLRCINCFISEKIHDAAIELKNNPGSSLSTAFREAIKQMVDTAAKAAAEAIIPELVRSELKKILREESADPHGTFSPD